jgi:hypothetical protein
MVAHAGPRMIAVAGGAPERHDLHRQCVEGQQTPLLRGGRPARNPGIVASER